MIVVADTSVILNLCRVEQQELLPVLYRRVVVPDAVVSEFQRLTLNSVRFEGITLPVWVEVLPSPLAMPSSVLSAHLGPGESAAISLALQERADAVLMLIDESIGRRIASGLGLDVIGIVGILIEARQRSLLMKVAPVLVRLQVEAGFWLSPALYERVVRSLGES